MARKRFTERQVIETLLHQGVEIRCYRTKVQITLENLKRLQREHLHELGLARDEQHRRELDVPGNCRYSLDEAHDVVTNGPPATTAGSSKNRIAKATHPNRTEKFIVKRNNDFVQAFMPIKPKRRWPEGRKIPSRPFQKRRANG